MLDEKKKILEIKSYQLIRKGLIILLIIESILFLIFGVRFFGVLMKNAFMLLFIVANITVILVLYWYFSYKEKILRQEIRK